MKFEILHLSDLHFRASWPEQIGLVYNKFIEDIAEQIKLASNPFLVFSGDLVNAASDPTAYLNFKEKVTQPLEDIGFLKERRIVVPGNHDVSRNPIKSRILTSLGSLSLLNDEESFLGELPSLIEGPFSGKFDDYIAAEKDFASMNCCQNGIGGDGWEHSKELGIYCLNTALCSFAGLENPKDHSRISDKGILSIDTRKLYQWIETNKSAFRILVMHHPIDWLADWAGDELGRIIESEFDVVLYGHYHVGSSSLVSQGAAGTVFSMAPPLFTRKEGRLGYSILVIDTELKSVEIRYREWSPSHVFVLGTGIAGNDEGRKLFNLAIQNNCGSQEPKFDFSTKDTEIVLEHEFNEASTCYSSKRQVWVNRDFAKHPETFDSIEAKNVTPPEDLIDKPRSCVIRAPRGFGLSALGRHMALEYFRSNGKNEVFVVCDLEQMENHRSGVLAYMSKRCTELSIKTSQVRGVILDGWINTSANNRVIRYVREEYGDVAFILLQGFEDFLDIQNSDLSKEASGFEAIYLRSLTRSRIRELVKGYLEEAGSSLDEDLVANKLVEDIDSLNMHRTPLNCLLLLKLIEKAFDDSPVNRTQMIGNVLFSLFHEFDKIPSYSTRPDLIDCEFALGYLSEWLIRANRRSFTKVEFEHKVKEYLDRQAIELDVEVLFSFLCSEKILIRRGIDFGFRHGYWLCYFTAQRMHHNKEFARFILENSRYSAFPEVVEFYTGIDRMRDDALTVLIQDLRKMSGDFLIRTGISADFNPFALAEWKPSEKALENMQLEVVESVRESSLPSDVKDAVADGTYDCAKPYHQDVAKFITKSSLDQMIHAMKGASRALRNSDHGNPELKAQLLEAVMNCWIRMCQLLAMLSPVLATNRRAQFDGIGFYLDETFKNEESPDSLWKSVMTAIVDNVVSWYQKDLFSKKLAPLLRGYAENKKGDLGELLVLLTISVQRPPGWKDMIEEFIVRAKKNSFYLLKVYCCLRHEFRVGFTSEHTRQQIRNLSAMAVAKHGTGIKHPNQKLIAETADLIDKNDAQVVEEPPVKK